MEMMSKWEGLWISSPSTSWLAAPTSQQVAPLSQKLQGFLIELLNVLTTHLTPLTRKVTSVCSWVGTDSASCHPPHLYWPAQRSLCTAFKENFLENSVFNTP